MKPVAKANLEDCLLKSAHPELVSPEAPVQSTETEASGWFVLTTAIAELSCGLLGRKGRGTRQGGATTVDGFRSYNPDVLVISPDCSLRHGQKTQFYFL